MRFSRLFLASTLITLLAACGGGGGGTSSSISIPVTPAYAQTDPQAGALNGAGVIIDTGPWPCDRNLRTWKWENPSQGPIKVLLSRQWMGLDYGLESDAQATSTIYGPGGVPQRLLTIQQLDNYRHRSFEQERWVSYSPAFVVVPVGGGIKIDAFCNPISGGANAHVTLAIWHF